MKNDLHIIQLKICVVFFGPRNYDIIIKSCLLSINK